jgi:hypothetical protein
MKKSIILIIINVVLFVLLRIASVLVAFLLGIGASAPSEKYAPYVLIIPVVLQLLLIFLLFRKKKIIQEKIELFLLIVLTLILFGLGQIGVIPF